MKGTTAELCTKMTKRLKTIKMMIMGASQKRLRVFKKSHNSLSNPIFDISPLPNLKLLSIIIVFFDRPVKPIRGPVYLKFPV